MKLRHRIIVWVLALAMLAAGSGIVSFADTMGDGSSFVMSAEDPSRDIRDVEAAEKAPKAMASIEAADTEPETDRSAGERADNSDAASDKTGSSGGEDGAGSRADAGAAKDKDKDADGAGNKADVNAAKDKEKDADGAGSRADADAAKDKDNGAEDAGNKADADAVKDGAKAPSGAAAGVKTATDKKTYKVTAKYGAEAGIPAGAELTVTEIEADSDAYDAYVDGAAEKLGQKPENISSARAFDISFADPETGRRYQPDSSVSISIRYLDGKFNKDSGVSVVHFPGTDAEKTEASDVDASEAEIMDAEVKGRTASFDAEGFSVYVVIEHEGGTVVTPRVCFHFIDPEKQEGQDGSDIYYFSDGYEFRNKGSAGMQTTQILKDGESLEQIADPENSGNSYFYGWYVVDPHVISGTTDEHGIGKQNGKLYYTWPAGPDRIRFESGISIEGSSVGIGDTVSWTLSGVSGSGPVDSDGCAHVFLAPVFENYHFVNFMQHARDNDTAGQSASNLMTSKLVVFGNADSIDVKISDIRSTSTDAVRRIFKGWEYNAGTESAPDWVEVPTVDFTGEEMKDPGKDGVYISVTESVDLYPIFVEARWVDFRSGASGSGASFVGSRYLLSWGESNPEGMPETDGESVFMTLPAPTRKGYHFGGWYAGVTDYDSATGEFTTGTLITETTVTDGKVPVRADLNQKWQEAGSDAYEVSDGMLRFYEGLSRLTLYAKWTPDNTNLTIVYWTENAENDEFFSRSVKTVSTEELNDQLGTSYGSGSEITLSELKQYKVTSGSHQVSILDTAYLDDVGAVAAGEQIFYDLKESPADENDASFEESVVISGSGSTIFNVYYSRKVFTLVFHIGRDGYVSTSGDQRSPNNGSWLQKFYNDSIATGYDAAEGINPQGSRGASASGSASMTYKGKTYTNAYATNAGNVKNYYVPDENEDVYMIRAKYGAYIGDRWPSPSNEDFTFSSSVSGRTMYIWSAYYGSLYCRIANDRGASDNQGDHPDINGIYNYMSAELCSNRDGTDIINENQTHHFVAFFGNSNNNSRFKTYHVLYEAIDGTYDPDSVTIRQGSAYAGYSSTTWTTDVAHVNSSILNGRSFYEDKVYDVISNLQPQYQLGSEYDGYELLYSCYDTPQTNKYDIYFLYTPKKYKLTFMYEEAADRKTDEYYYKQPLADARRYEDPEKEGYRFLGWYTNEAGSGEPFDFEHTGMPSMNLVLYPVFEKLNYVVKIDPNGGEIDRWRPSSTSAGASTGFRADYMETIGSYDFLERNFIRTDADEIARLGQNGIQIDPQTDIFYYLNTQYISEEHDGRFIPEGLRNALYLTESEIDEYWTYYSSVSEDAFTERGAVKITDKNEWMDYYLGGHDLSSLPMYRRLIGSEHYTFQGWHEVSADGTVDSVPFNFNTPITENIELRAMWRLDGGYYVQYNPYSFEEDGEGNIVSVIGEMQQWTDPADPATQLYADQTQTHILRAPTNTMQGWVFRGWYVVRADGERSYTDQEGHEHTFTNWVPIQTDESGQPVYYSPGDEFTVDALLVSDIPEGGNGIIHMQAHYEPAGSSYRRPEVTNLILDANDEYGGYVSATDSAQLPALSGPGSLSINTEDELDGSGRPTQILFGDFQSNLAVHLYRYAASQEHDGVQGSRFFVNKDGHLLIGFDEESDPEHPSTGSAYVPEFASDSVAAVTRSDSRTLYAMWEPMIYATFVNTTGKDLTVELSGSGTGTVSIVNEVTGEFDREHTTATIVVPKKTGSKNGQVKVVLPGARPGTDSITAEAINRHAEYKLSVSGSFGDEDPYGTGSGNIRLDKTSTYTGTLQTDPDGIIITYTEEPDQTIVYDVNGGTGGSWTETDTDYAAVDSDNDKNYKQSGTDDEQFVIYAEGVEDRGGDYEPAEPRRSGKVFIGWTINEDIAAHTDFSSTEEVTWGETTITPAEGHNILDVIRANDDHMYLWDFTEEPPYGRTLYAVWSDAVKVTYDLIVTDSSIYGWGGPETTDVEGDYVYYRSSTSARIVTYTLAKGDKALKPKNPVNTVTTRNWSFLGWVTFRKGDGSWTNRTASPASAEWRNALFDFSEPVLEDKILYTSWTSVDTQHFEFTVINRIIDPVRDDEEFEYVISLENAGVNQNNNPLETDVLTIPSSVTEGLKDGENFTIAIDVTKEPHSGWTGYDARILIKDSDGRAIKDDHIFSYPDRSGVLFNETSQYKYTLKIRQQPKAHYTTEVAGSGADQAIIEINEPDQRFTFTSRIGGRFGAEVNGFVKDENKSVTVTFTNKGEFIEVAPTGFRSRLMPYIFLLCGGAALALAAAAARRRREDADAGVE